MTVVAERLRIVAAPDGREVVASDILVPRAHGDWPAAHVPGCVVKTDDAGHLLRDPVEEFVEQVRWLRDGTPPGQG
jgi:hypothetical protein